MQDVKLDFRIDGVWLLVEPTPKEWTWLRKCCEHVRKLRKVQGKALEALLGHSFSQFPICRPYFFIFEEVYDLAQKWRDRGCTGRIDLNHKAREEVRVLSTLLPHLRARMKATPYFKIGASDSSDTHSCLAYTVTTP